MPLPLDYPGRTDRHTTNDRSPRAHALAAVWFAALALLAACSQQQEGGLESAEAGSRPLGFDVAAIIAELRAPAGERSTEALLAALPEPAGRTVTAVPNRHTPGQTDRIVTLAFPGVTIEVYEVSATSRRLLKSVRVSRSDAPFEGLTVGMSEGAARRAVGAAPLASGAGWEAFLLNGQYAPATLRLELEDGALSAYTIHGYLD